MSIGNWTPNQSSDSISIDDAFLQRCLTIADSDDINNLNSILTEQEKQQSQIMHAQQEVWNSSLKTYSIEQLHALIRFFTLAEMQIAGWEAGSQSPVIAIHQYLKNQGEKLDKEMLLWIRKNSTNRFIPYGAVL